jgi:hypothetical protein
MRLISDDDNCINLSINDGTNNNLQINRDGIISLNSTGTRRISSYGSIGIRQESDISSGDFFTINSESTAELTASSGIRHLYLLLLRLVNLAQLLILH